ncbi:MAG: ribonucrease [Actinomycetota bacterium]
MLIGIGVAIGIVAGVALALLAVRVFGATGVGKAQRIRRQLVEDAEREAEALRRESERVAEALRREAEREAEALRREAQIGAREQAVKLRSEIDSELAERRQRVAKIEERLLGKEEEIERKLVQLGRRDQGLADRETHLRELQEDLKQANAAQQTELERVAGMTLQEAKSHLLERGEELVRHDLARRVRMLEEEARAESKRRARNLVADALQRVAASHAAETTVSVVELPSDDMKGRIIGREGRNIRALEHLTGVDFIIDDTPHAVVLSSFDGLRREVARLTLTKLIEDGRIHPARIEEMYYQSKAETEDVVRQAGEQAVFEANCGPFHEELVKVLGRLRFRTSYGQNVLKHTLEVVHLAGIMASELEASVKTAKRAAMLHDLGKAMTHEVEGSHALVSAQLARRYGEAQGVVHAIEAHHYEVQPQTVEAVLLIAADAISASRPGARGESLEHYIKRLEALEELAGAKKGVEKVYALQAGREIRVIVRPSDVDDDSAALLSHEIAREIEDQLEYPGQVKVTVIRESRSVDVARNATRGGTDDRAAADGAGRRPLPPGRDEPLLRSGESAVSPPRG